MRTEKNVQVVKDFFAAIGSGDKQRLLSLVRWPNRARLARVCHSRIGHSR